MLFKKSTLLLAIAIQMLTLSSFVSAQTSDFGTLKISGEESLDFKSAEKWQYPFGGQSDRLALYFSNDTRFELITEPGFSAGDKVHRFELDTFLNNSTSHKGCLGDATVVSVEWDGTSGNGIKSLELDFKGTCYTDNNSPIAGKVLFNIADKEVVKQKVSLTIDGYEVPNYKSLQMFSDASSPNIPGNSLVATFLDHRFEFYTEPGFKAGHTSSFAIYYYNQETNIFKDGCYGEATVKSVRWNLQKPNIVDDIELNFIVNNCQYTNYIVAPKGTFSIKKDIEICEGSQALIDENNKLKEGIEVLNNEIDSLNLKLKDSGLLITKLESELKETRAKAQLYFDNLQIEKSNYAALKASTAKEIEVFNKQLTAIKTQLTDALLKLGQKEAELKSALATNASLTSQLTNNKTVISALKSQVTSLQAANLKLKTENAALLKIINGLKKRAALRR